MFNGPIARLVPPTAVTYGLESGQSTWIWSDPGSSAGDSYPLSPAEKKNPMPSAAPAWNTSS